jgi:hypothetical protein
LTKIVAAIAAVIALLLGFAGVANAAPAPVITSISPNQATAPGNITINGTDLGPNFVTVKFGNTATTYTGSSTQLVAAIPAGTGTVNVTVTTLDGVSNAVPFTYGQTPPAPGSKVVVGPGIAISSGVNPVVPDERGMFGSFCTLGAVGRDNSNRLVAVVAGHCNSERNVHQEVRLADTAAGRGRTIGTYETAGNWDGYHDADDYPADSTTDYAVILLDESAVTPSNTLPNGKVINKNYLGPITPGMGMAHYGNLSGWQQGTVAAYNGTDPSHRDYNIIYSANVVNVPSDSGGPVRIGGNGQNACGVDCGFAGVNSSFSLAGPPARSYDPNDPASRPGAFQFCGIKGILEDILAQVGPTGIGAGFDPSKI